jgi:hypothetical protein
MRDSVRGRCEGEFEGGCEGVREGVKGSSFISRPDQASPGSDGFGICSEKLPHFWMTRRCAR